MNPLVDKEQVILRLQRLKEYLKILKLLQKYSLKEIENDPFKTGALLHYLQLSAEISLDIGQIIISAENFAVPKDSAQIFTILNKEKILSLKLAETFSAIARFRNLLVHEYVKVDLNRVYKYLHSELDQFEYYSQAIAKYLKKNSH